MTDIYCFVTHHGTGDGALLTDGLPGGVESPLGLLTEKFLGIGPAFRLDGIRFVVSVAELGRLLLVLFPGDPGTKSMSASSTFGENHN